MRPFGSLSMQRLPGFRDFYPEECAFRNLLFETWRKVARSFGFLEYDGPTLEPTELYKKKSGEWFFDQKQFKSVEEAWQAARSGFVEAFRRAAAGEWTTISDIPGINWGPALSTKSLYCYFPDQLLPICSVTHFRHFLRLLGVEEKDLKGYEPVRLNQEFRNFDFLSPWEGTDYVLPGDEKAKS